VPKKPDFITCLEDIAARKEQGSQVANTYNCRMCGKAFLKPPATCPECSRVAAGSLSKLVSEQTIRKITDLLGRKLEAIEFTDFDSDLLIRGAEFSMHWMSAAKAIFREILQ
jgi:primosomal protein N'